MSTLSPTDAMLEAVAGPTGHPSTLRRQAEHAADQARRRYAAACEAHLFEGAAADRMLEAEEQVDFAEMRLRRVEAGAAMREERTRRRMR